MAQHITTNSGSLTARILRGDRVRFKDGHAAVYRRAYEFDANATFTVTSGKDFEGRLYIDGAPFCVWPRDVELAWSSAAERRAALLAAGHVK
jgi:hypothetical protein